MAKSTANKKKPSGTRSRKVSSVRRICNVVPSKGTETDWTFQDAVASAALGAVSAPPASVDLRAAWWTIGNQEDTGSCVGWATADGVARYQMVKANKLAKNVQLSPRFVWMGSKETDEFTNRPESFIEEAGTSLKSAMDVGAQVRRGDHEPAAVPHHHEDVHSPARTRSTPRRRSSRQPRTSTCSGT